MIPNPWDVGSARALAQLGFVALATTSSGFAWSLGRKDNHVSQPVNILVGGDFATVGELANAGVRRISVGGALARAAWTGFLQAAHEIAKRGTFAGLSGAVPFGDIKHVRPRIAWLGDDILSPQ